MRDSKIYTAVRLFVAHQLYRSLDKAEDRRLIQHSMDPSEMLEQVVAPLEGSPGAATSVATFNTTIENLLLSLLMNL